MKLLLSLLIALAAMSFRGSETGIVSELMSKAARENKHVAVYFSGSDWCVVCKKFKREILETPEVKALLDENFIFYTADFPQRTELEPAVLSANEQLAEKLNREGNFPLLVIMDAGWKVKSVISYGKKATEVVDELRKSI